MTIKKILILVFIVLLSISFYLNIKYLEGIKIQENSKPIDYFTIVTIDCGTTGGRSGSSLKILYNGKEYFVGLPRGYCKGIEKGELKPILYYHKDEVFFKDRYVPFPYVYLGYIASVLVPLIGFIIYRKELNNHYSTM
ncbi:MAG: hypothetical protein WCY89_11490 [Flavobacteriaceae bacterium]